MSHAVPIIAAALPAALYAGSIARLWRRAGPGRGLRLSQAPWGAAGFALLLAILVSPLHHWSERSFTVHMIEHELLMALAAPLIVLGRPLTGILWAFPPAGRCFLGTLMTTPFIVAVWAFASSPVCVTTIHGLAIWAWHAPSLFAAALGSEFLHWLQHASFLITGLLFWSAMLRPTQTWLAILCLFATAIHTGLIGALLTFAPRTIYPPAAGLWGLSPIEDQQLAGLVMWVPGGIAYLGAALILAGHMLASSARVGAGPSP
jgi:cytochrome c oxidase assembly factor CtaG